MIIDELIFDRTQADISKLESIQNQARLNGFDALSDADKTYWLGTIVKGAYNYTDINRVEDAVDYMADELIAVRLALKAYAEALGVAWDIVFEPPYNSDDYADIVTYVWTDTDVPTKTDLERHLNNVKLLREALEYDTPKLPDSMSNLDYNGANAIEKALKSLYVALNELEDKTEKLLENTAQTFVYSGTVQSGMIWGEFIAG